MSDLLLQTIRDWTIRRKILTGFAAVLLVTTGLGAYAIRAAGIYQLDPGAFSGTPGDREFRGQVERALLLHPPREGAYERLGGGKGAGREARAACCFDRRHLGLTLHLRSG